VAAARRAGIGVVALRCGGWSASALGDAAAVYDDPRDLLFHFASSPFSPVASLEAVVSRPRWVEPVAARHA
jgi:hypothetical protein